MAKVLLSILCAIVLTTVSFGQDGSNIIYVKPEKLDRTHIGALLHIDFGERTRGFLGMPKQGQTVPIAINKIEKVDFVEWRYDDGYNNWFKDQYLESVMVIRGKKLRIYQSKLLGFDDRSIRVEMYFRYHTLKGAPVENSEFVFETEFAKNDISEVLIRDY